MEMIKFHTLHRKDSIDDGIFLSNEECKEVFGCTMAELAKDPQMALGQRIKVSYGQKALELHPDKNKDDTVAAKAKFQALNQTYQVMVKLQNPLPPSLVSRIAASVSHALNQAYQVMAGLQNSPSSSAGRIPASVSVSGAIKA